jgi:hypothetical protein
VTIRQQLRETASPCCVGGPWEERQSTKKATQIAIFAGFPDKRRLAIYARRAMVYEKTCKSTRRMSLAGGDL